MLHVDEQSDTTKLIVAFRNFADTPKNEFAQLAVCNALRYVLDDQKILVQCPASVVIFNFSTASAHTGRVELQTHIFLISPSDEGDRLMVYR